MRKVALLLLLLALAAPVRAEEPLFVRDAGDPEKPLYWRFQEAPLDEVLRVISAEIGWGLHVDSDLETPTVTAAFDGVPAAEALRRILAPRHLTLRFWDRYEEASVAFVEPGDRPWRPLSAITSSFSLRTTVSGFECILRFTSDGRTARWRYLPLAHAYTWCGNSYDYFEQGELPLATYQALRQTAQSLAWVSDVSPGLPVWPARDVFTVVVGDAWLRVGPDQITRHPRLRAFVDRVFATVPSKRLRWKPKGFMVRDEGPVERPVRNPDVQEAFTAAFDPQAPVSLEGEQTVAEALETVRGQAGGHYFAAPAAADLRVTLHLRGASAADALQQVARAAGQELHLVDDLVLIGPSAEFPSQMREWRSVEHPPGARWVHLDLPDDPELPARVAFLEFAGRGAVALAPDPQGGFRALGSGMEMRNVLGWVDQFSGRGFAYSEEDLAEVIQDDVSLQFLSVQEAEDLARQVAPDVTVVHPGRRGYDLELRGPRRGCRSAADALWEADRLEKVSRVTGTEGDALVHGMEPLRERLGGPFYLFRQRYSSTRALLVRGDRGRLNQSTELNGAVERLDAPGLAEFVQERYGLELESDERGIIVVNAP